MKIVVYLYCPLGRLYYKEAFSAFSQVRIWTIQAVLRK